MSRRTGMRLALVVACAAGSVAGASEVLVPLLEYGASGWRHSIVAHGAVPGFEAPTFDDAAWPIGSFPFGTGGYCGLGYAIYWPTNTDLLVRRTVAVPSGAAIRVYCRIDNDAQAFVDGVAISAPAIFDGCGGAERYVATSAGGHGATVVVAARLHDRGGESHANLRVDAVFSADCDGDGTLDYHEIAGGAPDADANGVPDACEPCLGDVNLDRRVDPVDLALVFDAWGRSDAKALEADLDASGAVDGGDLATVLFHWGGCD